MAIIRFNPFRSWMRPWFWEDEFEPAELTLTEGLNIYEQDNKIFVEASVPGIPEDKIEVTYEDGVLHIIGRHEEKEEKKKKDKIIHKMERVASFDYTTYLPRPIDVKKIQATVKNGVITVSAPIAPEAKPKRIPVVSSK
ncbi:MAG: Hsp20/alpha crystallin family protein [Microgenomates group bacterium]|nr:Hsp20/alpha crystallin family protein [Microgenomates group bacterium]